MAFSNYEYYLPFSLFIILLGWCTWSLFTLKKGVLFKCDWFWSFGIYLFLEWPFHQPTLLFSSLHVALILLILLELFISILSWVSSWFGWVVWWHVRAYIALLYNVYVASSVECLIRHEGDLHFICNCGTSSYKSESAPWMCSVRSWFRWIEVQRWVLRCLVLFDGYASLRKCFFVIASCASG